MVLKKIKNRKSAATTSRHLISDKLPKSPISEQYRTIRTNIQFSAVDRNLRSIMVTSSGPSEGKSTTASNMAVVFAQQGKKVLFIDADMRKPTAHYTFQQSNVTGLTTVLTKQSTLTESINPTRIDNLDILTSGPIPPNPAELLSSKAMQEMLEAAYLQYDMVIFDTPPVLAVTDAQLLANKCDGTLMVVASGSTEKESAQKAKELLDAAQAKILGVVLNGKKRQDGALYYYYGGK
ncbi:CpsD/CapB family tyrosine-protein kinase [Sutcliffiella rhizosphaerae]|uniref:non-specific protein-tyrosine kinase n=1 Tax=Sutcliffiella rhizosphaerae TaxID=2880967 RepID=A0ABM8YJS9_9BACI|nr:CpsD/CapB family tyrosine-protein kinase [Sutcliffiella rhizosphaerae]CAG9620191.1 Tyrosine-protein kinase YwqD [Sutcliffiella rhizosphaerae]